LGGFCYYRIMKLTKHLVEKPWGRTDIPAAFGDMAGKQIGEIWFEHDGPDPLRLLVKWLFTSEKLSIQVHPNDAQADDRGMPSGKEECWYIVDAEPGAVLGIGTKQSLDADQLHAASLSGEIEQLMDWKPVKAGDYFYIPAGTVHAIGAGINLVEVQQYADITYRLYDYGRPRELHLDDGVAVARAHPYTDLRSGHVSGTKQLVDGPHFQLWFVDDAADLANLLADKQLLITPIRGEARVAGDKATVGECVLAEAGAVISLGMNTQVLVAA
jgi:mannose-6-phosphate isomerase